MLNEIPVLDSSSRSVSLADKVAHEVHVEYIESALAFYEACFEASSVLELALWKTKMDAESCDVTDGKLSVDMRLQHRNSCGASVIIPHVLSYFFIDNSEEDEDEEGEDDEEEEGVGGADGEGGGGREQ
jgi:hypothetical protein